MHRELSGGMCKRCGIARAFYSSSKLLLLDELFQALDVHLRAEMHGLLRMIWKETQQAMLFVTRDIDEALAVRRHAARVETQGRELMRNLEPDA